MASRLWAGDAAPRTLIRCWGEFAIENAATGADLRPRGRKARALLAYLALHPGKAVGRERLMGLLWGERAEEQARGSLRQTLFELRDLSHGDHAPLHVGREAVELDVEGIETDVDRWRMLAAERHFEDLLAALPDADDLLFANLDGVDAGFDEWLQVERTRQREVLIAIVADASAAAVAAGQTRSARALHARLVEFNPEEGTPAPAAPPPDRAPPSAAVPQSRRRFIAPIAAGLFVSALAGAVWLENGKPAPPASSPTPAREAGDLYENAQAIIYHRNGPQLPVAEKLLRRALTLDPNYVPAIAGLAAVIEMSDPTQDRHQEAERLARRAVQLDPNNARANGVLGMVLRFESDDARAAIKRAASLDGSDPEIQFWLSNVLGIEGDYVGRLQALRRAAAIDPYWHRASGPASLASWEMGYPEEAERHAARLREADLSESFLCDYSIDWAKGDYSEVVRDTLAARDRLASSGLVDLKLGMALLVLGHEQPARLLLRLSPALWRVASDAGPAPGELEPLLIAGETEGRADFFVPTALRQLVRDGRADEVVAAYDRRVARLGRIASGTAANSELIDEGLQVALALRAQKREAEAARLLAQADAAIRKSMAYGRIPNWMYASAAGVWAAQGRHEDALGALKTALDSGWHYSPMTPHPDMRDIPSFASLRDDPRFEQMRRHELDHLAREQRETGPVPV
ncbi:hypothetical protein SCH01S_28_00680 [Sphingomonas changbaiensis NBRC 104936]|uniref:Uncharacterized protein n=1 Tax=Sphingomonas changbaiensis NBRC 104936 TaxID=1219043 RepID=A0A0E9MNT2_9SPHN|nr:hypothetical protein [Sphingomonas changbaiensis]GAO39209.1 hypothetical protein SCH01S_28_00680 [Sphingomonas changbaiensis NBRC 104936]